MEDIIDKGSDCENVRKEIYGNNNLEKEDIFLLILIA